MINTNKLVELLINKLDNFDGEQFSKNRASDIMDLFGGSYRGISRNKEKRVSNLFNEVGIDLNNFNNPSDAISALSFKDPITRTITKPLRMGYDIKELITDPKWSLKNNKIGLTKDAILIKLLSDYFNDEEENSLDEGEL